MFAGAHEIKQCILKNKAVQIHKLKKEISELETEYLALESKAELLSASKDIYLLQTHIG